MSSLEQTRITVSTRPYWYQVTPWPIDAGELDERLEAILNHDWLRFGGHRRVEVTATDNLGAVRSIRRDPWPSRCPHCGADL